MPVAGLVVSADQPDFLIAAAPVAHRPFRASRVAERLGDRLPRVTLSERDVNENFSISTAAPCPARRNCVCAGSAPRLHEAHLGEGHTRGWPATSARRQYAMDALVRRLLERLRRVDPWPRLM